MHSNDDKREWIDPAQGLSDSQVQERIDAGCVNTQDERITKSYEEIFRDNVLTLFNLINAILAGLIIFIGSFKNLLFLGVVISNLVIGILQEIRAKRVLDKLSLITQPYLKVLRNGKEMELHMDDIVLDDILCLSTGSQVCADAMVVEGRLEVNESLVTGESDIIVKHTHDTLYSGSFVVSGQAKVQVQHVGKDNYAATIMKDAKTFKKHKSQLRDSINFIIKTIGIIIIPVGILLFSKQFFLTESTLPQAIVSTVAALLGMIPEGLVLLTSVALAVGSINLAKRKTLVQELYCIETLARVDTLCLDKTGTITTGDLKVEALLPLCDEAETDMEYIRSFLHYSDDNNATYQALCAQISPCAVHEPKARIPFSSLRKWSSAYFEGYGSLVMGAPEKLLEKLDTSFSAIMEEGKRMVVIGRCAQVIDKDAPLPIIQPLYAVIFTDTIRPHVEKTLQFFREEDVNIKIISGDHITAVSAIARQAGLHNWNACLDMSGIGDDPFVIEQLAEQYAVFGRVTPLQKKLLVQALQKKGHAVAMSGDGVNDMLALKEADCSIAIAQGSDAVKQMSQIVLLDSDFSALPMILKEGRRVVNNATRVAGVFFIKTIYSILLSVLCIVMNLPFPFIPIQITLIDLAIEAFPSFLTMLEPDHRKVNGDFLSTVLRNALPNAIAIVYSFLAIEFMSDGFSIRYDEAVTMMYVCVAVISMLAVYHSSRPLNRLRTLICICMTAGFILAILLFHNLLHITLLSFRLLILTAILALSAILVRQILMLLLPWIPGLRPQPNNARQHSLS